MGNESTQTPRPPRPRRRLASIANVRAALASALRDLENDVINPGKARATFYGLSILAACIESSELEARLNVLEAQAAERREA